MFRRLRWFLLGAVVVVLAIVGFAAWYIFGDDAPSKPELSATATTDVRPGTATPDGTWKVVPGGGSSPETFLGYRMTEAFGGDTLHRTAVGRTKKVAGTVTISSGRVTAVDVTGDLRDLSSDRAPRDNYIHTHGLESDRFPDARFVLTKPIALPANPRPGQKVHTDATGTLTAHGVTRSVTLTLDARWTGSTLEIVGTAPVALADYGIDPPDTSVVKVDPTGSFEWQLVLRRG